MDTQLGIIGVGQMGGGMWRNLQGKGHIAAVYDVNPAACEPLAAMEAPVAKSPADLAAQSQTILLSLPTSRHVEDALLGKDGVVEGARPGTTIIDTTSGHPTMTKEIARRVEERGLHMIDAGISGGARGALDGTLLIMIGGDSSIVEKHMPLFELLGKTIHHCGDVGAGHTMKTLLNLRNQTTIILTVEVLLIGAKAGLDPMKVAEVTGAGMIYTDMIMNPEGRRAVGFSLGLASKDQDVALSLAMDLGVPAMVSSSAQQFLRMALAEVGPDADVWRYVDIQENWAGQRLPGRDAADA
ncbi:MAG: NAD(P)-dependent oxidoreductase [Chloroflexi bacterium]|nr:NAD(P)-dependent oxidoreductase [Chloroflexota bacterium]